jgi:hypothetical protein
MRSAASPSAQAHASCRRFVRAGVHRPLTIGGEIHHGRVGEAFLA